MLPSSKIKTIVFNLMVASLSAGLVPISMAQITQAYQDTSGHLHEVSYELLDIASKSYIGEITVKDEGTQPIDEKLPEIDRSDFMSTRPLAGWTTIMTEEFEGTWPSSGWSVGSNYTYEGTPITWDPETYHKYNGSKSAFPHGSVIDPLTTWSLTPSAGNTIQSNMIYGPFSLADATDARLIFYLSYQLGAGDQVIWLASTNGTNYHGYGYSGGSNWPSWTQKTFDLKSVPTLGNLCGQSSVYIMFLYIADDVQDYNEAAYVDDILLEKESASLAITVTSPSSDQTVLPGMSVDIAWTGSGPSGSTVNLLRDADQTWDNGNHSWLVLSRPTSGSWPWNTSGVAAGTYYIAGMITDGSSEAHDYASGRVTVITQLTTPTLSGPSSAVNSGQSYTLSWNSINLADRYLIQESTNPSFSGPTSEYVTSTSWSGSHTVSSSTTYYYRVCADNSTYGGTSDWSNTVTVNVNPDQEPDIDVQPTELTINQTQSQTTNSPHLIKQNGSDIEEIIIDGPPEPPPGYYRNAVKLPEPNPAAGVNVISDVPAFDWSFGCTATSAAMIAGYYDRTGYPNMYAGPTNGGVTPLDNSSWPDWVDSHGDTRHQCPLSATHNGLDGRTTNGHVDDYWKWYGQPGPDPWDGNWTQHTYGECTSDYMKTNQWVNPDEGFNIDGGTVVYTYGSGNPLTAAQIEAGGIDIYDGPYGLKLFYESRGHTVTNMYNQKIEEQGTTPGAGFTYDHYKAEIDAGRPVMIHVTGHTMVGVGYDDASNLMYIHDTWDYNTYTMTWNGTYSGMQHKAVSIVQLEAVSGSDTFTIYNVGNSALTINSIPDDQNWLSTTGYPTPPFDIQPGGSQVVTVNVNWSLISSPSQGIITVNSNDPDEPSVPVTVNANPTGAPPAPVLSSPTNGATDQPTTLTLDWNASSGATSYRLQVDDDPNFGSPYYDQSGLTSTDQQVSGLANNTTYHWRANAANASGTSPWSSVWQFTTIISPPPAPVLSSPSNGATDQPTTLTLDWNESSTANSYRLQVDDDPNFGSPHYDQAGLTSTEQQISGLSNVTTYHWRANAANAGGTSPWSSVWQFTTIIGGPPAPVLSSPSNGATDQPTTLTLEWNASSTATSYRLQVDDDPNFGSPHYDQSGLTSTEQQVSGLANNTTYNWRANAANAGGTSPWSSVWQFTTIIDPNVTYRAVVVGIADYPGTVNDLDYTDDDAQDIHDTLVARPEWNDANIQMIFDSDATQSNIQSAINTMGNISDANDVCLFFFSGHGTNTQDVAPLDESDGLDEALYVYDGLLLDDDLGAWFGGFSTGKIAIILDACYSGGLIKQPIPGIKTLPSNRISSKGDGMTEDLKKMLKAKDLDDNGTGVVLTACDDDEFCVESGSIENGAWTYYVVEAMTQQSTDTNGNNWISAEEIYVYAAPLATAFYSDQHAQIYDGYEGELDILSISDGQVHDIVLDDIWFVPNPLVPGQGATLHCQITNQGDFSEEVSTIVLTFTGPSGSTKQMDLALADRSVGIGPGETDTLEAPLSADFIPGTEGLYNCSVCILPVSGETDTDNNCRTEQIQVGESGDHVVATVGCDNICEGNQIVVPIEIDMSGMSSPNEKLGSFTCTLDWDENHLDYVSNSGILSGFTGIVNVSPGHIDFNGANSSGVGGVFDILNVTFDVIGSTGQSGTIDLDFSAMSSAVTFFNLLPFLTIEDCDYTINPCGILGDVNGDEMVNSTDALIVLSCDVGIDVSQFCPMNCGDVNDDGFINSTDALIILSYDVGMEVPFPVGEPGCPQEVTPCPGCNQ